MRALSKRHSLYVFSGAKAFVFHRPPPHQLRQHSTATTPLQAAHVGEASTTRVGGCAPGRQAQWRRQRQGAVWQRHRGDARGRGRDYLCGAFPISHGRHHARRPRGPLCALWPGGQCPAHAEQEPGGRAAHCSATTRQNTHTRTHVDTHARNFALTPTWDHTCAQRVYVDCTIA